MRFFLTLFALPITLLFTGCETARRPSTYLSHFDLKQPQVNDFEICSSAGCRNTSELGYTTNEWQSILAIFQPTPTTAAEERERIKIAVAAMEQINGLKNGTSGDAPRNRRSEGTGAQLDCIAEAANSTVALMLFDQEGLLKYHSVGYPQHRGFFRLRLPHNTASIYEKSTGAHYTVDSWFYKNGEPPVCVPVNEWKAGYDPED
ncbi:hypothetical protein ACWPKO_09825 [Coraliomargarita sp. W4R53]